MMANVVGVLVVVMAVTQISVGHAVKRIFALASDEASELQQRRADLSALWTELAPQAEAAQSELRRLEVHLRALRSDPATAEPSIGDGATLEASLAQRRLRTRRLEEEIASHQTGLSHLRVELRDLPPGPAHATTRLRLPDPRPAAPGSSRVEFFCRYGRVLPVELALLEKRVISGVRRIVGSESGSVQLQLRDLSRIVNHFRSHDVGSEELRWQVLDRGPGALIARLAWRGPQVGSTSDDLSRAGSGYRQLLAARVPGRHHFHYWVWSDSFQVYLEARRLAEERGFDAGWTAIDARREFEGNLLGPPRLDNPIPID